MRAFATLDDADIKNKRVLVRVDLNVPVVGGKVTDRTRIERIAPTIIELVDKGGKVILLSHFGRPSGHDPKQSLKLLVPAIADVLKRPVAFAEDCIGKEATAAVAAMNPGDIVCLENTRFHVGEEENDPDFVAKLAALGDIFVNDAFSVAHRAHASVEGLGHKLPTYAGRTMQAELEAREIVAHAEAKGREIVLPVDAVVAQKLEANVPSRVVSVNAIGAFDMILDIGPRSVQRVISVLAQAKTLVWNGPFGAFEVKPFDQGTIEVAKATAELTEAGKLVSVAGGGDTVAALNSAIVAEQFTYVSTAGGAFLEWLEGKALPGVEMLAADRCP
jgi:phosphoglycerate kinase